jgi:3-dehydroquinate synthase
VIEPHRVVRQGSGSYPVYIGPGLLEHAGEIVGGMSGGKRPFVIVPRSLRARYGERVAASFRSGIEVIDFDDGETSKTLGTVDAIVTRLLESGAKRDSVAVVVGGGVAGDTAGFAASVFLRGIDLVHVPTTLLAQVDSSIGGKLAVNHPLGKNLIGSFYPPRAVISDIGTLATLPRREIVSGLMEALKGGVIGDVTLFAAFENEVDPDALSATLMTAIIRKAVDVKANIVSADERESDLRRLLNYGHTLAHGVEAALGYEQLTHGEAVGWGMIGANAIAVRRGLLAAAVAGAIERAILRLSPARIPQIDRSRTIEAIRHDKKFTSGRMVMVLPRAIGQCIVVDDVRADEIECGLDAMLAASR